MNLVFSPQAWEDSLYWQAHDRKKLERINRLIAEIVRTPTTGTGKPEPLKHALRGYWSRRIDDEHRIVYRVEGEQLWIVQVRFHYE
jgi:toxin YoeB